MATIQIRPILHASPPRYRGIAALSDGTTREVEGRSVADLERAAMALDAEAILGPYWPVPDGLAGAA